jgi:hypothetical protein
MRNRSLEQKLINHHLQNSLRLRQIVDEADRTRNALSDVVDALHSLLIDPKFAAVLRNERFGRMPMVLHDLLLARRP